MRANVSSTPGPHGRRLQSYVIGANKVAVVAANAGVLLVASRTLGHEEFGVFSAILGASVLLGRLLLLGCEFGYTRLRTMSVAEVDERPLAGAAIAVTVAGSVLLAVALALASGAGLTTAGTAAAITLASAGWAATELAYWIFLVQSRPGAAMLAQGGTVAGRAGAVASVALLTGASSPPLALTYGAAGLVLGAAALFRAARRHAVRPSREITATLLRYSAWQGIAQVLTTLAIWFGSFALLLAGKPAESGQFSLAITITAGVLTLAYGLTEHLMVRVAELAHGDQLGRFLRRAFVQSGLVMVACGGLLAIAGVVCYWLFPPPLWRAAVYVPLALSVLVTVLYAPLEAAAHYLVAPQLTFTARLVRLGCTVTAGVPLAITSGAASLAWLQAAAVGAGLIWLAIAVRRRSRGVTSW